MRAASTRAPSVRTALAGIVVLAAAVRFSTLGVQSYWLDESFTVHIVKLPLGDLWSQVRTTEGSPPLYYYLAWPWSRVFGTSVPYDPDGPGYNDFQMQGR